jgi:tRNA modification GTPase
MLYNLEDTIAAVCTPPGTGAAGVIRVSGRGAVGIVNSFFIPSGKTPFDQTPSHTLVHGWISDNGKPVDEVMAAVMRGPRSYTGDDTVEITAHGGKAILERILSLAASRGARLAGPGEFTFRAYSNGKLDLAEAEAVADLVSSKTGAALDTALAHLKGSYSAKISTLKEKLASLLANLEASLDHAGEDIDFISKDKIHATLSGLKDDITSILEASGKARFLKEGLRAVIIGKPNAGKSSLLNALLARERAIVADMPGTTRDVLEETLEIGGVPVVLLDTAGIRAHAQDPVEKLGQNRTLEALKSAGLALWVLDASTGFTDQDIHIYDTLKAAAAGKTFIPVWNKADISLEGLPASFGFPGGEVKALSVCAKTGMGLKDLETALSAEISSAGAPEGNITANARHIDALRRARQELEEALSSLKNGFSEEVQASRARAALSCLGEITGETATEEILARIFKNFCVGK